MTTTTLPALTDTQKKLRELWLAQPHTEFEDTDSLVQKLNDEDGFTWKEINAFVELIEKEYQTGLYLYPPPPITRDNAHLHMREPDDSWMYAV